MFFVRQFTAAIGFVLLLVPTLFRWAKAAIDTGGGIDFILSRHRDPGWVGAMIGWILDPPVWATVPLAVVGLLLIGWSNWHAQKAFRRKLKEALENGLIENPERVKSSPPYLRLKALVSPENGRLSPEGRVVEGKAEFLKLYEKAIADDDYEAYLIVNEAAEWLERNSRFFYASSSGYQSIAQLVDERMHDLHQNFTVIRSKRR